MTSPNQVNHPAIRFGNGLSKTARLFGAASLAALTATVISPSSAMAQVDQADTYSGGKSRVNNSGKLTAYSEAAAASGCRLAAGIEEDVARDEVNSIQNNFNTILAGLETGSSALGMPGAERSSVVLRSVAAVKENWGSIDTTLSAMVNGDMSGASTIIDQRGPLFDSAYILASDVSGVYSDPQELLQSDAITFNFIGRQRTLANQMSRTTCELATGTGDAAALREELAQTKSLFEASLNALQEGFPNAGISPPPNDAVSSSLDQIETLWDANKGILDATIAGETPDADDVVRVADMVRDLGVAINNTVTLYLIASPGQSGVYRVPLRAYAETELASWMADPAVIDAIKTQNAAHANLTMADIDAMDQQWIANASSGTGPIIDDLMSRPLSKWLLEKQNATAGFVTEVFIMDNKGLNVAQSEITSDYMQGDEAKWQQTYLVGPDAMHISDVEFDDSTGFYQSQASFSITDPDTGEVIGAVTFGVNVQSLM